MNGENEYSIADLREIFTEVIKNVSIGIYFHDISTGEIDTCNEAFARICGYQTIEEVIGKVSWDFVDQKDVAVSKNQLDETGFFIGEVDGYTRSKEKILMSLTLVNIIPIGAVIGIAQDITKQRVMEKRLRESEAKYRALVDTITEGLIITDSEEKIVFTNPAFAKSLGYKKSELIGRNVSEITSEDQHKIILKQMEVRRQGKTGFYDISLLTKDSTEKKFFINAAPLFDGDSNYAGAIALCVDSTKILSNTNRELETRGFFLKMMTSEIEEQLFRANGWLDILFSDVSLPDQKRKIIKIKDNLLRINNVSKQTSEIIPLIKNKNLIKITVSSFLELLKERLNPLVQSKSCTLETNHLIDNPELFECPRILEYALEQIIRDSLNRESSSINIQISIKEENKLQILIVDDGKAFIEKNESSEYLMGFYLADVILKQIGGSLSYKHTMPGKGIQIKLTFSSE